jgi:hypothetical protein
MAFSEPQSPGSIGNKRPRCSSLDLEAMEAQIAYHTANVTIPQCRSGNELTTALIQKIKDNAYTHNLLPNNVSDALTKFLSNTKLSVDTDYFIGKVVPPSEDGVLLDSTTKEFKTLFGEIKKTLCSRMKQTAPKEFLTKLVDHELEDFRATRNVLTKWFISCQHLEMKLNSNSNSRDYVRLNLSFSTNFELTELKEYCDKEMENLKLKLERKLTLAKLDECLKMTQKIHAMIDGMQDSEQTLILRAFRAVILGNKSIAKDLISYIPIGPTYRPIVRPQNTNRVNPWHQNNRRQGDKDRQVSHRSDRYDPPPQRRESRIYRGQQHDRYRGRDQHNDDYRYREYTRDDRFDRRRNARRYSRDHYQARADSYDDDFPSYDGNYKQKKRRYQSNNNDDVFEAQPRRPSDRDKRWV